MSRRDFAIEFEQVSKRYERYPLTLKDSVGVLLRGGRARGAGASPQARSEFWAIRDLSFAVTRGETLGIIGANGAGKSTVLKMIAGITAPTGGRLMVQGRVGSLIELGAGFNQELSGRENIFLNGAVLGLSRGEIDRTFDKIAAFSGVGEFLDVPVKYYSSGMYARLGFSIAIHVNAEILLTDEILAVGDAAFQRQCYKKFQELKGAGTIVFVSHDLAAIERICSRALWIKEGRLQCDGPPEEVTEAYLHWLELDREQKVPARRAPDADLGASRRGTGEIEIVEVMICDGAGRPRTVFRTHGELLVRICYRINGRYREPEFGVNICGDNDVFLHGTNTFHQGVSVKMEGDGGTIEVLYPRLPLMGGAYWVTVGVTSDNDWTAPYDVWERAKKFEVLRNSPEGGLVCFDHSWRHYV